MDEMNREGAFAIALRSKGREERRKERRKERRSAILSWEEINKAYAKSLFSPLIFALFASLRFILPYITA
ncbi:hypothetical protein [Trichormus variabilis]|uniref:hypothetical protein n=1 Tax=Anabaena variabilis TaxID=264691 RepID=UPI000F8E582F|nr:hypothetical protein [Trichormus variabilis]MBD2625099.1 hypothetical protein [Trichormus variabilis FACHB-164]